MNTHTDNIKKTSLKGYENKSFIKDAQKILKAFYMVTMLFPESETIGFSIRENALSLIHELFSYTRNNNKVSLINAQSYLYEIMSLSDVARSVDLISDMNYFILESEVKKLESNLKSISLVKDSDNDFLSSMFKEQKSLLKKENDNLQDTLVLAVKKEIKKPLSDINHYKAESLVSFKKETKTEGLSLSQKDKRHKNILSILKQKKDASITDVCSLFKDCSSKTIQRDLKELIKNNKVTKKGERRWAVYNLI